MSVPFDSSYADNIVNLLERVCRPSGSDIVPLHEPTFGGNELKYLYDCIESGWVSTVGKYVSKFEEKLAEFCGVKRAVAVVNGTAALKLALLVSGVERGDEVLIPSLTFVATANAVTYLGGIVHFVDSEEDTLGIDPCKLDAYLAKIAVRKEGATFNKITGAKIAALVPMHVFGHPSQLDELKSLAEKWSLKLVEDSAESLGSYYKGKHTGSVGLMGAISFNGNKIITAGGGGAILTNDEKLADQAKHLSTTAKVTDDWKIGHDQVGFNDRMPNLNAAVALAQLEQLPEFIEKKNFLTQQYRKCFSDVEGLRFFEPMPGCESNFWLNTVILDQGMEKVLEMVLKKANDKGLMTRPIWEPLHTLKMYTGNPRMDLTVCEGLLSRVINLPSGASVLK